MKNLITAIALMLVSAAFAQDSQYCRKPDDNTTICKFSDGRVNVTSYYSDGTYFSDWYTAAQWKAKQAKEAAAEKRRLAHNYDAQKIADYCKENPTSFYGTPGTPSGVDCKTFLHPAPKETK
jgi:hypothetical protein